jgi:hypothetical protein
MRKSAISVVAQENPEVQHHFSDRWDVTLTKHNAKNFTSERAVFFGK